MRAYLAACGMGVGHIIRCEPLAEALSSSGAEVVYSTYSEGADYVARKKLPRVSTVPLSVSVDENGAIDFKRTAATDPGFFRGIWEIIRQIVAEIRNILASRPDVVISDTRVSPIIAARLLSTPTVLILNQYNVFLVKRPSNGSSGIMDRLFYLVANLVWMFVRVIIGEFWSLADITIVPDLPPPNTLSVHNLAIPSRYRKSVRFVGPLAKCPSTCRQDKTVTRQKLGLATDKPIVFAPISMPKSARDGFLQSFEAILRGLTSDYQIVLSRGVIDGARSPRKEGDLLVYDWIDNQFDFYLASDAVVSRAGHGTIMNAIQSGRPMVVIPIPNHPEQARNAKRASELGIAKLLPQSHLSAEELSRSIKEVLETRAYSARASEMQKLVQTMDGLGETLDAIRSLLATSEPMPNSPQMRIEQKEL